MKGMLTKKQRVVLSLIFLSRNEKKQPCGQSSVGPPKRSHEQLRQQSQKTPRRQRQRLRPRDEISAALHAIAKQEAVQIEMCS